LLPRQATYYFTRAQIPRALPEDELAAQANALGLKGRSFPTVVEAVDTARAHAKPKDLIVVFGSVFVVAEV
jgi:dihydrofolate synthase/folylpolyglutamate synthase